MSELHILPNGQTQAVTIEDKLRALYHADHQPEAPCPTGADTAAPEPREAVSLISEQPNADMLKLLPSAEDDANAPPPQWLVDGLIEQNTDVALYAPLSFLKSFVALDLCFAVATGRAALGVLPVLQRGPVVYFCGEGYHDIRQRRRCAWEIEHGFQPFNVPDIWFAPGVPVINDEQVIERYIAAIKHRTAGQPLALFALDTLNRALNGMDEDRASTASRYFNVVSEIRKQTGGTSLTIGHMSHKSNDRDERGSSAFPAGYDTILWIADHHKDEETGTHTLRIRVRKQKSIEDGAEFYLQSKLVGTPAGHSLVLGPLTEDAYRQALARKDKITIAEEMVEAALKELATPGIIIGTIALARKIRELNPDPVSSEETVRKTLSRQRSKRFAKFAAEPSGWTLPRDRWGSDGRSFIDQLTDDCKPDGQ
jgi:hypothetical protein